MPDPSPLEIAVTPSADGGHTVVSVRGDIDIANAGTISSLITDAVAEAVCARVVLDLSGVDFMDSSGVSALMATQRELHEADIALEVVGAHGAPLTVLRLTGVLDLLSAAPDASPTNGTATNGTATNGTATNGTATDLRRGAKRQRITRSVVRRSA